MNRLDLHGHWDVCWAEGLHRSNPLHLVQMNCEARSFIPAEVPEPVHFSLERAGLIGDPNVGLNSLGARWVEEVVWVYRRTIEVPREVFDGAAWLVFECLDLEASVWINGACVGRHCNANRPFRVRVDEHLKPGENLIAVQVASGRVYTAAAEDSAIQTHVHGDMRRTWCRHPQYVTGWDWNPRLMPVGILGDVWLEWSALPILHDAACVGVVQKDLHHGVLRVRPEIYGTPGHHDVELHVEIVEAGLQDSMIVDMTEAAPACELEIPLQQPRLWYPTGHGEPFRYTVTVSLRCGDTVQELTRRVGFRHVAIDQAPHPQRGTYCTLVVNGNPVFCKGGNFVPPSLFWSTVSADHYRTLVDLAVETNFNMLRIWGGGTWAHEALCEACDEAGIMIWHDLLFACATYPGGHHDAYREEVRREAHCGLRRRVHHPSIVVWCGNNEVDQASATRCEPGTSFSNLFLEDLAHAAAEEAPNTPWWPASPHSPVGMIPNDPHHGDQHPWAVTLGCFQSTPVEGPACDFRLYRQHVDRFSNEGGVLSASPLPTLRAFLPEAERRFFSPVWQHHDNYHGGATPFGGEPGEAGAPWKAVKFWTNADPFTMDMASYVFVSMLLQAEGLVEYFQNFRRRMFDSGAAIYWMFNDSWPTTHGWPIFDFYLRRKLAFHPVRRACAPLTVIVCEEDDEKTIGIYGVNDTLEPWQGMLKWGICGLSGSTHDATESPVKLPANASTLLGRLERGQWEAVGTPSSCVFGLLSDQAGRVVAQDRLFVDRFCDLAFAEPEVTVQRDGDDVVFECPVFAWAVCLDLDGETPLPDDGFDLLPEVPYRMPWDKDRALPVIQRIGSRDAV